MQAVKFVILEHCTDTALFVQFVCILLKKGTLLRGDICIINNCSIHIHGDNIGVQCELYKNNVALMITLPPYYPDFNPAELVFNTLHQRLIRLRERYIYYIEKKIAQDNNRDERILFE